MDFIMYACLQWSVKTKNSVTKKTFFIPFTGYYCIPEQVIAGDITSVKTDCPQGWFCPNGTGHNWRPCPSGSYGGSVRLTQALDCTPCDGGKYCQGKLMLCLYCLSNDVG